MTTFTRKPDKNSGHDPDDAYPVRCACGQLLMTDAQRRAHCGPCPEYDGTLERVTIDDREEADR